MPEQIFLHLLILFGIWSQAIIGISTEESSDLLVRQKRVISYVPDEDKPELITNAPYVVYIKERQRVSCTGTIMSVYVVITAATCVPMDPQRYKVIPGSRRSDYAGYVHNVTEIRRRIGDPHTRTEDGVALLIVNPPITYNAYIHPIRLHIGPLLVGSFGKVHGWGFNFRNENPVQWRHPLPAAYWTELVRASRQFCNKYLGSLNLDSRITLSDFSRGTNHPANLRSIEVPIILHQNCVNRYRPHVEISEKNVCTYHPQRHCGHNDFGAGLIVDNGLAGVFLWSGLLDKTDPQYPDVFASLQDPYYNRWIRSNVESIDSHFQNLHHH